MTDLLDDRSTLAQMRRDWLIKTLYALRAHFREAKPKTGDDLSTIASGKEGLIIECADGRQDESTDLKLGRGGLSDDGRFLGAEYYKYTALGTSLPSKQELKPVGNTVRSELMAVLTRALLPTPSKKRRPPKNLIIIGHDNCGANSTLLADQLGEKIPPERRDEAAVMRPKGSQELSIALKAAHDPSLVTKRDRLHRKVTESTVLQSMCNAFRYKVLGAAASPTKRTAIISLVEQGKVHVIGAIRGMKIKNGSFPLEVYDPKAQRFQPIEKLYDELFIGNNRRSDETIETKMNEWLEKQHNTSFSTEKPLTSHEGIRNIDAALGIIVEDIYKMVPKSRPPDMAKTS